MAADARFSRLPHLPPAIPRSAGHRPRRDKTGQILHRRREKSGTFLTGHVLPAKHGLDIDGLRTTALLPGEKSRVQDESPDEVFTAVLLAYSNAGMITWESLAGNAYGPYAACLP